MGLQSAVTSQSLVNEDNLWWGWSLDGWSSASCLICLQIGRMLGILMYRGIFATDYSCFSLN